MRKTREYELHPAPSWWGKNDVLKELIYLITGLEVTQATPAPPTYPPPNSPSITGTPADHLSQ